jgi:hypothetical protein
VPLPTERSQLGTLGRAFLARFFENETTAQTTDMRQSFFWLIAAFGTPGVMMPLMMYFRWAAVGAKRGIPAMHQAMLLDKTLYLSVTCVAMLMLTALVWQALLVDRRDGLVLGTLPVRGRTIVLGKLVSLLAYVGLVSLGMHAMGTIIYGLGKASLEDFALTFRFMAAQLGGATAANALVFGVVVGAQSVVLAIWGPRRFSRMSSLLQIGVIGAATGLLLLIPLMGGHAEAMARWTPGQPEHFVYWLPPMWFVGLNEVISGSDFPLMSVLAGRAMMALGAVAVVIAIAYPIAARRVLAGSVDGSGSVRTPWLRTIAAKLTRALGRNPHERGAVQFLLATLARSHQHRIIVSISIGAALTLLTPIAILYFEGVNIDPWTFRRGRPMVSLLSAPMLFNFLLVGGLRIAMAVPSELPAAWMFAAAPSPIFAGRNAARRLLVLFGVAIPMTLAGALWCSLWGAGRALPLIVALTFAMLAMIEGVLWGFVGIPCAKSLAPGRSGLTSRWPALLPFVYFYADRLPATLITAKIGPWVIAAVMIATWWFMRRGSASAAFANGMGGDPHGYLSLDLSTTAGGTGMKERHA